MASATVETICCMSSEYEPAVLINLQYRYISYNVVCMISSIFGMIGAIYQVLPSPSQNLPQRHRNIGLTQKAIINWLAMADFFAASGILVRSAFWIWRGESDFAEGWDLIACAGLAVWIRFFYTATFLWTLFYAVDVHLVCRQKTGNQLCYHAVTWITSLILTLGGLGTLYLPSLECHSGIWRVLPNYLLSYIPIVVIMIINPVLYYLSSKNVRVLLTGTLGQLTYLEHNLLAALKEKFFCIVIVYYVCWIPNVINGIIMWGFWPNLPQQFLIGLWFFMAGINPLQAVLNSLVYKGWDGCLTSYRELKQLCCCWQEPPHPGLLIEYSSSDNQLTQERTTFSTNNHFE